MVTKIKYKIFAKVNLSLNITGRTENMHLLDMIMASVNIADAITLRLRKDDNINIRFSDKSIDPVNNTVFKTAGIIKRAHGPFGADIKIDKGIPIGAGLGGSSADAAGLLLITDELFGLSRRGFSLSEMALEAGSDVPYMLHGGYMRVSGTGEKTERIDCPYTVDMVLCGRGEGLSAGAVYAEYDKSAKPPKACNNEKIVAALKAGNLDKLGESTGNMLYSAAAGLQPDLENVRQEVLRSGAMTAFMTGSGNYIAGLYKSKTEAEAAVKQLKKKGMHAAAVRTLSRGSEIIYRL